MFVVRCSDLRAPSSIHDLPSLLSDRLTAILEGDGERRLIVRKALAGYCLAHWSVDCSREHRLEPMHFRLALKNMLVL